MIFICLLKKKKYIFSQMEKGKKIKYKVRLKIKSVLLQNTYIKFLLFTYFFLF